MNRSLSSVMAHQEEYICDYCKRTLEIENGSPRAHHHDFTPTSYTKIDREERRWVVWRAPDGDWRVSTSSVVFNNARESSYEVYRVIPEQDAEQDAEQREKRLLSLLSRVEQIFGWATRDGGDLPDELRGVQLDLRAALKEKGK